MATLTKQQIIEALAGLGEVAQAEGATIELALLGGAVMVLDFGTREATKDVDAVIVAPEVVSQVREWSRFVAGNLALPEDWLNDAAKGFLVGLSRGPVIWESPGIIVWRPGVTQLLAMKLCAWRDDVDIADARRLLQELSEVTDQKRTWSMIEPYLIPGSELKAQYAFDDLWENLHGND